MESKLNTVKLIPLDTSNQDQISISTVYSKGYRNVPSDQRREKSFVSSWNLKQSSTFFKQTEIYNHFMQRMQKIMLRQRWYFRLKLNNKILKKKKPSTYFEIQFKLETSTDFRATISHVIGNIAFHPMAFTSADVNCLLYLMLIIFKNDTTYSILFRTRMNRYLITYHAIKQLVVGLKTKT